MKGLRAEKKKLARDLARKTGQVAAVESSAVEKKRLKESLKRKIERIARSPNVPTGPKPVGFTNLRYRGAYKRAHKMLDDVAESTRDGTVAKVNLAARLATADSDSRWVARKVIDDGPDVIRKVVFDDARKVDQKTMSAEDAVALKIQLGLSQI